MTLAPGETINVLVSSGSLGSGVRDAELAAGIAMGAHVIATDAGSTDSGAAYLALGMSKNNRGAVKRDLLSLMKAQVSAKIPIVIGTAGQAGGDLNVDWTRDIIVEVARELGVTPKIAVIYTELTRETVKSFNREGKISSLAPLGPLDDDTIDSCDHIVAAIGVEPFIEALSKGADIVIAGRATDTAVLACVPIMKGAPWGPSWHAGKTGECGVQCAVNPILGAGIFLRVGADGFSVEPLTPENRCDPYSVSKHMLYENSDPFHLTEPGGILDVSDAQYEQVDERAVKVTGSRWDARPYTQKLEGAGAGAFQTIMFVGVQDPAVLADVEGFHDRLLDALLERTRQSIPADELGEFDISLRMYGWNAVSGEPVTDGSPAPREIGIMFVATARTQDLATQIAKACNPYFFHFPATAGADLPSYGFPFTPADVPRGRVYEFKLNHVIHTEDPLALVRFDWPVLD
jgi:hypothetical protein